MRRRRAEAHAPRAAAAAALVATLGLLAAAHAKAPAGALFNDSHFHLTNYVQKGPSAREFLATMGSSVGRSTLFGIPLQQTWSYENSGDFAPSYYLQTDAPLYYYSFTDAYIAHQYLALSPKERERFDPMITGFNPADMYGVDHVRRVLELYPGVFSGIGEFTIHKEFVSSKVAGETASLTNPALDRILDFAAEVGLLVLIHSDINVPFPKPGVEPVYLEQMKNLLRRHASATIIWAHTGLGRVVSPVEHQATAPADRFNPGHLDLVEAILLDPALRHVYFDISWDEVAKYALSSPEREARTAKFFEAHADRLLFGTDNVAPPDQATHLATFHLWDPIWGRLSPTASRQIRLGNYERLFDAARERVRAWERAHVRR